MLCNHAFISNWTLLLRFIFSQDCVFWKWYMYIQIWCCVIKCYLLFITTCDYICLCVIMFGVQAIKSITVYGFWSKVLNESIVFMALKLLFYSLNYWKFDVYYKCFKWSWWCLTWFYYALTELFTPGSLGCINKRHSDSIYSSESISRIKSAHFGSHIPLILARKHVMFNLSV